MENCTRGALPYVVEALGRPQPGTSAPGRTPPRTDVDGVLGLALSSDGLAGSVLICRNGRTSRPNFMSYTISFGLTRYPQVLTRTFTSHLEDL
jgi:hypothetical protein